MYLGRDMEQFIGCVIVIAVLVLAVTGIIDIATDARGYKSIERSCVEKGYIQDKRTKIHCSVELLGPTK